MRMNIKNLTYGLLAVGSLLVSSCVYDESEHIMKGGINLVRFLGIEDKFILVSITPEPQELALVAVKRDPISSGELSKAASVDVVLDAAVLDQYNVDNGTDFTLLDPASYTFVGSSTSISFAAGEDVKDIAVNIDPSFLDLSLSYAIAFVIKNPSSDYTLGVGYDTAVVQVIIKNQYDGVYHSIGTRYNYGSIGAYGGWDVPNSLPLGAYTPFPWEFDTPMSTRGAATVNVHIGNSNGGLGYANVTVNEDNTVTIESTSETGVGLFKALEGADSPQSYYDPETQTFHLWYQWTNGGGTGTHRVCYAELVRN
jgi:hypothetical protein